MQNIGEKLTMKDERKVFKQKVPLRMEWTNTPFYLKKWANITEVSKKLSTFDQVITGESLLNLSAKSHLWKD